MGCRASSGRGLLWIGHFDVFPTTPGYEGRGLMWYAAPWNRRAWADSAPKWRHFGMRYWHEEFSGGEFTYVGFSYWHIIGPPAFLLCLGAVAARTRQNGCCRTCGYDLRATPKRGAVPVSAVECLPP
jgi:hypothetical protein